MKKKRRITRRRFLRNSSLGLGIGAAGSSIPKPYLAGSTGSAQSQVRLPREVWIASVTLEKINAKSYEDMIEKVIARMNLSLPYRPDIICLPEKFPTIKLYGVPKPSLSEIAEVPLGPISGRFAEWAKKNQCYVVCPICTKEDGRYYNSAVFIDRNGKLMGEYRKARLTVSEMENGLTPGPLDPPVFETDFGIIGAQICYDINWYDGWRELRKKGAEIVFWPSAFPAGVMLNTMAWMNKYVLVSSTRDDPTRICDIDGKDIDTTGIFRDWICAPVNLEKAFVHIWPYVLKYNDIRAQYGRNIRITSYHDEGWTIIESLSPDIRVADVLKEFEIKTHEEHIRTAEDMQVRYKT